LTPRCYAGRSNRFCTDTNLGRAYGIRADEDGLLAAGQPGVQLTWMTRRSATGL
jgi:hypothetical protein